VSFGRGTRAGTAIQHLQQTPLLTPHVPALSRVLAGDPEHPQTSPPHSLRFLKRPFPHISHAALNFLNSKGQRWYLKYAHAANTTGPWFLGIPPMLQKYNKHGGEQGPNVVGPCPHS